MLDDLACGDRTRHEHNFTCRYSILDFDKAKKLLVTCTLLYFYLIGRRVKLANMRFVFQHLVIDLTVPRNAEWLKVVAQYHFPPNIYLQENTEFVPNL
jgi:hypothetical protein